MIKKSNHDLIYVTKKGGKIKDCRHGESVYEIKVKIPKSRRNKHPKEAPQKDTTTGKKPLYNIS